VNTQFEWLIEEEGERWEPSANTEFAPLRAVPRWAWLALLMVLSIALPTGWIGVRHRYQQAVAQATFEIQGMVDLEVQVVASCDRRRFLALQDPAAPRWVAHQVQRLDEHCLGSEAVPAQAYRTNLIGLPARVQEVTLEEDVAWAQVVTDEEREQHVRFYRWTERGWMQAPPDPQFWGEPTVWQHTGLLVQGTVRDLPYGKVLAAHIWDVTQAVCDTLGCTDDLELRVTFIPDATGQLPRVSAQGLLLPSPWLTGIPANGEVTAGSLKRLTYWTAYYVTSAAVGGPGVGSRNPTQKAILAEYARLHTDASLESAPILRRIVDRHGIGVLPQVLRSLPEARALSDLLPRWLALSAGMPDTYYAVLFDLARDPATRACKETFDLLLREDDAQWIEWTERSEGRDRT
jgi:hypothetical protein